MPSLSPAADPLPLVEQWLSEAAGETRKNPWAMALASVASGGRPSVRYVLLKHLSREPPFVTFYTNYGSRKAREFETSGLAAAVLYWPNFGRQLRFEGRVERSPVADSDAYFATRPRMSQLNAWASEQSAPIDSPDDMQDRLDARLAEFADTASVSRPDSWGGYRLYLDVIEFWLEGHDRFHERLRYDRAANGAWSNRYLQP